MNNGPHVYPTNHAPGIQIGHALGVISSYG